MPIGTLSGWRFIIEVEAEIVIQVSLIFLMAGMVKGMIGMGLPTVSLALLVLITGLANAMALMLLPSLVTNAWQTISGGRLFKLVKRLWLFFLCATILVFIGSRLFQQISQSLLLTLLGTLLVVYAVFGLLGYRWHIRSKQIHGMGLLFGSMNGILTGMTGSFVVPGVMYLQSVDLQRDELVQAMGILFTLSTLALGLALVNLSLAPVTLGTTSALAVLPALLGMVIGQRLRRKISEAVFRRIFFIALLLLGVFIVLKNQGFVGG